MSYECFFFFFKLNALTSQSRKHPNSGIVFCISLEHHLVNYAEYLFYLFSFFAPIAQEERNGMFFVNHLGEILAYGNNK